MKVAVLLAALVAANGLDARFAASDVAKRLLALNTDISQHLVLRAHELMVVTYVPKQGALSEWDDESRLVLYHEQPDHSFTRVQFVSKAGKSIKGHLSFLKAIDLDHDGIPEVVAVGRPYGPTGRIQSQIYRRPALDKPFEQVWNRRNHQAALHLGGGTLKYSFFDPVARQARTQTYVWRDGQLVEKSP